MLGGAAVPGASEFARGPYLDRDLLYDSDEVAMPPRPPIPGLNPDILVWARRRAGQDVDQVARKLGKSSEDVEAWEAGDSGPTYVQLEKLAYQVYKRPIALFFFPEPPEEDDPEHRFRTLPDFEVANLAPDTRFKIRDGLLGIETGK